VGSHGAGLPTFSLITHYLKVKLEIPQRRAHAVGSAFEKYAAELHRFLLHRLQRSQDAADLAQEVYLRLTRLESTDWIRKPRAYLYGVASHVVSEFRMRTQRDPVMFDSEAVERLAEDPECVTPDNLGDGVDAQRGLQQILAQLPPTHLAVLMLHKRDGLSYEEVARELGLSVHTVHKYVTQAKAQVKLKWQEQG
jgi:RNA polymerase sigma-19 factor, ECF subfamily